MMMLNYKYINGDYRYAYDTKFRTLCQAFLNFSTAFIYFRPVSQFTDIIKNIPDTTAVCQSGIMKFNLL